MTFQKFMESQEAQEAADRAHRAEAARILAAAWNARIPAMVGRLLSEARR